MTTRTINVDITQKLQLVVFHKGNTTRYYPISYDGGGWHIDTDTRQIVIGKGIPREFIPLDNVLSYWIEEIKQ